ncbi:Transposon Ty3-G Gag-Pol polyprotein [Vitis vinifera]|uniref:Transposon Ty3-G Gag-Pol polyprotein n=1 Tax=Vitis vinifera TaxID=29760 RepID=A0A438IAS4_VITVI|nr:Transposon Ty3-G Gag-Pol polyprotein [Vitis vinifera]
MWTLIFGARLYGIEKGIARGLWLDSSISDSNGKKPTIGQRSGDVSAISATRPRPPRYYQTIGMDLHCAYHRGPGHDTNHCTSLRHAIQDLIDQGLVHLGQPSVTTNPLPAHTSQAVPPPADGIHFMDFIKLDNHIHMLSWDESVSKPIVADGIYKCSNFIFLVHTPYVDDVHTPDIHWLFKPPNLICHFGQWLGPERLALAIAIALGYAPSDFGTQLKQLEHIITLRERAGAISSSLHQKVKFIHNGQVVTVRSIGDMFTSSEPMLQISHSEDDLFFTGFMFDEVQTLEIEYFCKDFVAMSFDQHSTVIDHDVPFGLGFIPTEANYRYMVRLHKEMVKARLTHTPFDYPIRPYNMSLANYFVRPPELQTHSAPGTSAFALTAPLSLDRMSLMTLYFPDEVDEHGTFAKIRDMVDGVVPHDGYIDEMLAMSMSQINRIVQPEFASPFDLFEVSAIEVAEEIQTASAMEFSEDDIVVDDLFESTIGPVGKASDFVDPPFSFDTFDIDDEITQHDSNDDSSSASNPGPIDQRVSPATRDTKMIDFGIADQPRELRIRLDLSIDERDSLVQLLKSYLDFLAWSYEDMSGLNPSIVKEDIQNQLSVGFLLVVEYPKWLANVVHVPKKDGKVRVCVDFRNLNKILIAPKDMEKTSFITQWGTYYYRVMSFGLKNAGATYQRATNTFFHNMMHQDVEVYVDNMIEKSQDRADHIAVLERFFERIRQFRLRLNPKKCTFGVTYGKLLGYMVSERGI